jgi:hypothetical protein
MNTSDIIIPLESKPTANSKPSRRRESKNVADSCLSRDVLILLTTMNRAQLEEVRRRATFLLHTKRYKS